MKLGYGGSKWSSMDMHKRILHIVENLNRGAVENWLVRMLRHAQKNGLDLDWTFYCVLDTPGRLEDEARSLGARIVRSPVPLKKKVAFMRALRAEVRRGDYQALHCHHDLTSAVYLLATIGLPIRVRIVHVHNADESIPTLNPLKQAVYRGLTRSICLSLADKVVGISNHTLDTFLAGRARRRGRDIVHYYGVDPSPFIGVSVDHLGFRRSLGLPHDALILLFAGRIVPEKNPVFVVDVLAELKRLEPRAVAVFAGVGSLESEVLSHAERFGIKSDIRMIGWQKNISQVMLTSDWFILPRPDSPKEGFGLAVVEAQLAGLRMILSEGIADDPLLPSACFRRLPLAAGPKNWAASAMDLMRDSRPDLVAALSAFEKSPLQMDRALAGLLDLYS